MTSEILAEVGASIPRRWLAVAMQMLLGLILVYVAMNTPPSFGWQVFLVVFGFASIGMALRTFRVTRDRIILTREGLHSSTGEEIIPFAEIKKVERGVFALKPSNGFTVIAHNKAPSRRWAPGLWWRFGRRVGVGGVAPGHQTKAMAQIIEALVVERDGIEP
jgi:hypothetical protein